MMLPRLASASRTPTSLDGSCAAAMLPLPQRYMRYTIVDVARYGHHILPAGKRPRVQFVRCFQHVAPQSLSQIRERDSRPTANFGPNNGISKFLTSTGTVHELEGVATNPTASNI